MRLLKGRMGYIAIKVDLEKAYDCLRWSFSHDTLILAGFLIVMVHLIIEVWHRPFLGFYGMGNLQRLFSLVEESDKETLCLPVVLSYV